MTDKSKHPCFNASAKSKYGRIHLPVAPDCNMQCNYCNRKFDCVNESRPGVTSALLTPEQAAGYLAAAQEACGNISVAGIAGPGDPFANPEETMKTLRLVRKRFPEMLFCISTNGLGIGPFIPELAEMGVTHVTITVNATDPEIAANIYSWMRYKKKVYRGVRAGALLLEKQTEAVKELKSHGITVKINTIIIPGINDFHIREVALKMQELGADIINCIPVYPNADSVFGEIAGPTAESVKEIRESIDFMPKMLHCARCRADAAGLIGKDNSDCMKLLKTFSEAGKKDLSSKPYVAAASREGMLVNWHLGEADCLHIFGEANGIFSKVDIRKTPKPGSGNTRWKELAETISDCRALLVGGVGNNPLSILKDEGIEVIEMSGLIEDGLYSVYEGAELRCVKSRDMFKCGRECSGSGGGCG